jgi:ABC-type phosphate transport system permease subunit
MSSDVERRPVAEIGVCTLVVAACLVVLWQASSLPPGTFEPLGSAPVPQATACIVILCCLVVIFSAARWMRKQDINGDPGITLKQHVHREFSGRSPYGALVMLFSTVVYTALLHSRLIPFGVLTFMFLLLVIWALNDFRRQAVIPASITALVFGFGTQLVFTRIFVIDLPV